MFLCIINLSLISLAQAARELNWVRPKIIDDDEQHEIVIEKGRHPLMELCTAQFVPNSIESAANKEGMAKVHILTGPNASGKSIYLKQVIL